MGGGLAAGAFFLGGQMQGQQQLQMYQQQMQMRMMEEQLRRAALLQQMQQSSNQAAALKKQPQDVQDAINLGMSPDKAMRLQDVPAQMALRRQQIQDDPNLTPQQKLDFAASLSPATLEIIGKHLDMKPTAPPKLADWEVFQQHPDIFDAMEREKHKYDKQPQDVQVPIGPADFTTGPGGATGVYLRDKSGAIRFQATPGAALKADKPPTGDEATIQAYLQANPGKNRLDAIKAIAGAKAAGSEPFKSGNKPLTPKDEGWNMTVNPSNGLPYVTGASAAPESGFKSLMGGSAADPNRRAAVALAQATALRGPKNVFKRDLPNGKREYYVRGTDNDNYKLMPDGSWQN